MSGPTMLVSLVLIAFCALTLVSTDDAAIQCDANSSPTVCVRYCPPQACNYTSNGRPCIPGPCRRGCTCHEGYCKTSNDKCVSIN
ncbi:zonadhesin-like [Pieris rapae]|uniref:zonadhesin-like n=1 Tax=Pieris rapae TaxID=64459 RepID=UPI001E281649|nr:zonadhesin-like [Pieris rapae]